MNNHSKVEKILECYRRLKEEAMSVGGGGLAGLPPDEPVVDFRKRKYKKLNMFYRSAVKPTKGAKNARKGPR